MYVCAEQTCVVCKFHVCAAHALHVFAHMGTRVICRRFLYVKTCERINGLIHAFYSLHTFSHFLWEYSRVCVSMCVYTHSLSIPIYGLLHVGHVKCWYLYMYVYRLLRYTNVNEKSLHFHVYIVLHIVVFIAEVKILVYIAHYQQRTLAARKHQGARIMDALLCFRYSFF